jgi:hypothetical protein
MLAIDKKVMVSEAAKRDKHDAIHQERPRHSGTITSSS